MSSPPVLVYRFGHWFYKIKLKPVGKFISYMNRLFFAAWIPSSAKIGRNFTAGYWGLGMVIHSNTVIGDNVTVGQNVTIGRNFGDKEVPKIGNDVYIGAGSVVFGEITIGNNVIIGSNSVINKSVPDNSTVAGNPFRIIAETAKKNTMKSIIKAFNIVLLLLCLLMHTTSFGQKLETIEIDFLDTYILKGEYENVTLCFRAKDKKIKTVIDGSEAVFKTNVRIQCRANNVEFVNFTVKNPKLEKNNDAVLELGEKDQDYENITVRNFNFLNEIKEDGYVGFFYINVMANNVKILDCTLKGKHNRLPMIHVNSKFTQVEISNCTFKDVEPRKEEALEAIRIGDGTPNTGSYFIKNNVFENYFGDSETISCKASNMHISGNRFNNCRSGISIRKANHVEIMYNSFTNVTHPVRVSGKDHKIIGNSFDDVSDQAISFMMGNADYWNSENIVVSKNKFKKAAKIGLISNTADGTYPTGVSFKNNYVVGKGKKKMKGKMLNKDFFEKTKPGSATEKYNIKQATYIIQ